MLLVTAWHSNYILTQYSFEFSKIYEHKTFNRVKNAHSPLKIAREID